MSIVIAVIGLIEALGCGIAVFMVLSKGSSATGTAINTLNSEVESRRVLAAEVQENAQQLVDPAPLGAIATELALVNDNIRAEQGRITITQAELDTVEVRLRELEEIERELEASGIETQEELKVLQKKEKELRTKNEALQEKINLSVDALEKILGELNVSAQVQEQILAMKTQLLGSEQKIATLMEQIEQCNEQYFHMKKRYDALDIEYAQLYEKFTELEAATKA